MSPISDVHGSAIRDSDQLVASTSDMGDLSDAMREIVLVVCGALLLCLDRKVAVAHCPN